jgi:uncharacterized membrane protein
VSFAYAVPTWLLISLLTLTAALAFVTYRAAWRALTPWQATVLVALRGVTLVALIVLLLRPMVPAPAVHREGTVAVVIDSSRSMALRDRTNGGTRLARAGSLARQRLQPALSRSFKVQVFAAHDTIELTEPEHLRPGGTQTDLQRTLHAVEERFRGRGLAGIVLVSDGAETVYRDQPPQREGRAPVVTVGMGEPVKFDREVRSVTADPSVLDGSLVDLAVTVVLRGDAQRVRLRLLQNGRVVEMRELTGTNGAPTQQIFTVAPDRGTTTIFRVELDGDARELTLDNNRMEVLVPPPGRRRRVLMLEGAPGFEHTFLKRAWQQDTSLEIDSVVRKGADDQGRDTYYVQASASRSAALSSGFPDTKEALFVYDTIVLANRDLQTVSRAQLDWIAEFVAERGGGLLAFGARTLSGSGLDGSSLQRVLPVTLDERHGGISRASVASDPARLKVMPTAEGLRHPLLRLSTKDGDRVGKWHALPALAGAAPVGAPRPGASVLAVTAAPTGTTVPLVSVQRFGRGRSMIFAGEASWRWKMLMPARDRTFDTFWRQAVRWLAIQSPDPVVLRGPAVAAMGSLVPLEAGVRDASFRPVEQPEVQITVHGPDGEEASLPVAPVPNRPGYYRGALAPAQPGVYRVSVTASRSGQALGTAAQFILAGGIDSELIDPGLNETVLRRIADESGGRYVRPQDVDTIAPWLLQTMPSPQREMRDLWHNPWMFVSLIALLSVEWGLRRRWGLR